MSSKKWHLITNDKLNEVIENKNKAIEALSPIDLYRHLCLV